MAIDLHIALDLLCKATSMPFCITEGKNPAYTFLDASTSIFTQQFTELCIDTFLNEQNDPSSPLVIIFEPTFFISVAQLTNHSYLLIGPSIPFRHTNEQIDHQMNSPFYQDQHLLTSLLLIQPLSKYHEFINIICLALYLFDQRQIDPNQIESFRIKSNNTNSAESDLTQYMFDAQENIFFHTPEQLETELCKAVESGDKGLVNRLITEPVNGRLGVLSLDPERQLRYMFVTAVGVIARAAMRGGLDYETACSTADIYCQQMDRTKDVTSIIALHEEMVFDFVSKVAILKGNDASSAIIRNCCDYIGKNLHSELSLAVLADYCHLSPRRLSLRFKKEMGLSVMDYIHEQRMKEAGRLLLYTSFSISEISNFLNYSTQSYFTLIFQKHYGITPSQYRNNQINTDS